MSAGTGTNTYWELYKSSGNTQYLDQMLKESTKPGYGTTKCNECFVTHPSQCKEPGYTQAMYDIGQPCACEYCSRQLMPGELYTDDAGGTVNPDDGHIYERSNYHCNTASGQCSCGSPPGQILMEHSEFPSTGGGAAAPNSVRKNVYWVLL